MESRPRLALLILLLAIVVGGTTAAALPAQKASAETTALRGTIALGGGPTGCPCPSGSYQVYLLHLASGKLTQLTTGPADHMAMGWSPDGSRLLVGQNAQGSDGLYGLYALRVSDSSELKLAPAFEWDEAQWSPNGRRVAYLAPGTGTARRLYVVNRDGTHRRLLTRNVGEIDVLFFGADDFSWSPNGRKILFARPQGLFTVTTTGRPVIHRMSVHGSSSGQVSQPTWSPDGSRIAFKMDGRLGVMRSDGTHRHILGGQRMVGVPVWSPNSAWIAIYCGNSVNCVAPSSLKRVRSWTASWSGLTFSPDSAKLAYVGGLTHAPTGAVYVANANGSSPIKVIDVQSLYFGRPLWRGGTAETQGG